jgi:hypothetical protein
MMLHGAGKQETSHEFIAQLTNQVRLHGMATEGGARAGMTIYVFFASSAARKAIRAFIAGHRQWATAHSRQKVFCVRFRCPVTFTGRDYSDLFDEFKAFVLNTIDPKHVRASWLQPISTRQFGSRGSFGDYALFGLIQQGEHQPEVVIRASFNDWGERSAPFIHRSARILYAFARKHGGRTIRIHLVECHHQTVNYALTIPWSRKQMAAHQSLRLLHELDLLIKKTLKLDDASKTITVKSRRPRR